MDIINQLRLVQERIDRANKDNHEVKLLLATKTVPPERIKIAFKAGYTLIAENKVQEVKEKFDELQDTPHTSHFIGHLQTNKIKELLKYNISCIHSVDRFDLAEQLNKRLDRELDIFIQVNTSNEASKFGVAPKDLTELMKKIDDLEKIKVKGLMTIGLLSEKSEKVRDGFKLLKELQQKIGVKELSMGMSGDLDIAIEEGATIVRVGTAIFGQRTYPDNHYWPI